MNEVDKILYQGIERIEFTYLERNPDNQQEFHRTFWVGNEARSRLSSIIHGTIHRRLQSIKEEVEENKLRAKGTFAPTLMDEYKLIGYIQALDSVLTILNKQDHERL